MKETVEVLRDWRTLLIALALPALVFPAFELFFACTANNVAELLKARVTRVCIIDSLGPGQAVATPGSLLNELKSDFLSSRRIRLLQPPEKMPPEQLIVRGLCDVVLKVRPSFSEDIKSCKLTLVELYDNACSDFMTDEQNVWEPLRKFADDQRSLRLASFNIPKEATRRIEVSIKTVESAKSRSAYWTAMIYTVMLVFAMLMSSMYPALDVITGERERGTLVLLLMAPGDRRSYVWGKLLTVTSVALTSAILTLLSASLSISLFVPTTIDLAGSFRLSLPVANLLASSIFLIPLALVISAAAILLSSYARTFQQGQSYFAPLVLFCIILTGLVLSCEESAPFFINLLPFANLMLCMFRAIQGQWGVIEIAAALLSSALYLFLLIRVAVGILDQEESLFGIKQPPGRLVSFAKEAFGLFAASLALFFYLTPFFQKWHPIWGLLAAQIVSVGIPAIIVPRLFKMQLIQTLSLVRPSIWSLVGAVLLAPMLAVISSGIAHFQSLIMPGAESYIKALQDYLMPKGAAAWTVYLTIALGPAVCEELLFRGAIQGMLRKTFRGPLLCSVVAVLFGIMHGSSYRFLPTSIMGFILALLTEYTGSLFPAVLLHLSNNAIACYEAGKETELSPVLVTSAVILAILGVLALRKGSKGKLSEKPRQEG